MIAPPTTSGSHFLKSVARLTRLSSYWRQPLIDAALSKKDTGYVNIAPLLPSIKSMTPDMSVLIVPTMFPTLFNLAVKRVEIIDKLDDITEIIPNGTYLAHSFFENNNKYPK